MPKKVVNEEIIAKIIILRGLGYKIEDIADELGLSYGTVRYNLSLLRKKTIIENPYIVYNRFLSIINNIVLKEIFSELRARILKKEKENGGS